MPRIVIDPDGTLDIGMGLLVIVESPTGVTYEHQCGGYSCQHRTVEGFLIPVGDATQAQEFYDWFWRNFKGWSPGPGQWTSEQINELQRRLATIPCWFTPTPGDKSEDKRSFLELDLSRIRDCVEAWIPVKTPYGKGVMILANSD